MQDHVIVGTITYQQQALLLSTRPVFRNGDMSIFYFIRRKELVSVSKTACIAAIYMERDKDQRLTNLLKKFLNKQENIRVEVFTDGKKFNDFLLTQEGSPFILLADSVLNNEAFWPSLRKTGDIFAFLFGSNVQNQIPNLKTRLHIDYSSSTPLEETANKVNIFTVKPAFQVFVQNAVKRNRLLLSEKRKAIEGAAQEEVDKEKDSKEPIVGEGDGLPENIPKTPSLDSDVDSDLRESKKGEANINADEISENNKKPTDELNYDLSDAERIALYRKNELLAQELSLSHRKREGKKTIGVWSLIPQFGVTSFVMNLAFYLGEKGVHTAVLEGVKSDYLILDLLKKYSEPPKDWQSLASFLHAPQTGKTPAWTYRDVNFLPLGYGDHLLDWDPSALTSYIRTTNIAEVTLVDLPSGEMNLITQHTLNHLDELWVLVDDFLVMRDVHENYFRQLQKEGGSAVYLIANKVRPVSKPEQTADRLKLKLLTSLPDLRDEAKKSIYRAEPFYIQRGVHEQLSQPFGVLTGHLFGKAFETKGRKRSFVRWLLPR
ncbi:hypothetical protein B0X71_19330 (plasmid) [Planococcus lenghuensis]|uniref:Uncharacterized protein n=1 Tax=Planococcus lenghuensis TaxID=2213202 RepID=A0A1Q2L4E2_9BACL|nr:hypothetical protein B0X71_19330 [Planococcus lenghuensis]